MSGEGWTEVGHTPEGGRVFMAPVGTPPLTFDPLRYLMESIARAEARVFAEQPYIDVVEQDIRQLAALTGSSYYQLTGRYEIDESPGSPLANLQRWYDAPGRD